MATALRDLFAFLPSFAFRGPSNQRYLDHHDEFQPDYLGQVARRRDQDDV
jgi:hypothetical protein